MSSEKKIAAAAAPTAPGGVQLYTAQYFALCGIGGILSCGLTHLAVTPIDLVKCNAQTNPVEFPNTTTGFRKIYSGALVKSGHGSGITGLFKGWGPTLAGYSAQGLCKFGFYEYFKWYYSGLVGEENAYKYRDFVYMGASASAEFIADLALCPFEAVKVRVQTSPSFAKGMVDGLPKIIATEGFGNLYAGLDLSGLVKSHIPSLSSSHSNVSLKLSTSDYQSLRKTSPK